MVRAVITTLVVVIPAHNEAELIGRAVRSALVAMTQAERSSDVRTMLTVVLDSCIDASSTSVAHASNGDSRVHAIEVSAGAVGRSRAVGIEYTLRQVAVPPERIWIANTDADSAVPPEWCASQLSHAANGADAVLGTVIPTREGSSEMTLAGWASEYRPIEGHTHVHGANLGVRADAYLDVGGFPPVTHDEDVRLTQALRQRGHNVVSTARGSVATSFRTSGRAPSGFAEYLSHIQGRS